MKAKLNFDKKSIMLFFASNGEKIAFAVAVLCFFFFLYIATGAKRFDKSPEELSKAVQEARAHIGRSRPDTITEEPWNPLDRLRLLEPPTVGPYALETLFNPPNFPPRGFRDHPELFPAEDLRATAGVGQLGQHGAGMAPGMMGMGGPGAAPPVGMGAGAAPPVGMGAGPGGEMAQSGPLGQRWVVLTGLVNYKDYHESYERCFQAAQNHTEKDYWPEFKGFEVERAEVTDESISDENLKWEKPYGSFRAEYERYTASQDLVEPRFVDPRLVFPLPPRADQTWGAEVVHDPEIPMYMPGEMMGDMGLPGAAGPDDDRGEFDIQDPGGMGAGMLGGPAGRGMGGPRGMGPAGMGPAGMGPAGMGPAGMGGFGGLGRTPSELAEAPYLLLRFFDYNVEPGKRYRYRVRLAVANPNYGYPAKDLVPELREQMRDPSRWKTYSFSKVSKSSDVVFVPRDDRLLASSVSTSRRVPVGKVVAVHWNEETGEEIYDEFDVARGTLANFLDREIPERETAAVMPGAPVGPPGVGAPPALEGMGLEGDAGRVARRPPRPKRGTTPEKPKIDYRTEMLVVDLRGGEPMPRGNRNVTWPGEILVLDPDGNLRVHGDVEDEVDIAQLKDRSTQPGGMPGGMGGPGGPVMMGGPGR